MDSFIFLFLSTIIEAQPTIVWKFSLSIIPVQQSILNSFKSKYIVQPIQSIHLISLVLNPFLSFSTFDYTAGEMWRGRVQVPYRLSVYFHKNLWLGIHHSFVFIIRTIFLSFILYKNHSTAPACIFFPFLSFILAHPGFAEGLNKTEVCLLTRN